MSEESIEIITKSDINFALTFVDYHFLPDKNFNGHYLVKNDISIYERVMTLYISYTLGPQLRHLSTDFTLSNFLLGSVKVTNNVDLDKYKYSCYGIGFHSCSEFEFTDRSMGKCFSVLELM